MRWGPTITDKEESENIKKEAEEYAIKKTGCALNKINRVSENIRRNWYQIYCRYINNFFTDMPSGWYLSSEKNIRKVIKNAIKCE